MINKLLIVGCGLIGSSILKKVCKKKIAKKVFVFEKSKKNQRTLKRFKFKFKLIKKIDKKISECDFIVICAPLSEYKKIFLACNRYSKKGVLITDAGSAKKNTITKINNNGIDVEVANFIETTIRRKELSKNKEEQNISRYNEGQKIDAKISSIDLTNRKFALSIRQLEIDEEQSLLEKYGSKSSGSVLGDILGKALDEDKDTKAE